MESIENCGNAGRLNDCDNSTVFVVVDIYAEELWWGAEIGHLGFFWEPDPNFDYRFGNIFWEQYWDVIDIHKNQNTITTGIYVGVSLGLCAFARV